MSKHKKLNAASQSVLCDPRHVAVEVLLSVLNGMHSQAALDSALRKHGLELKNQALCTELVYGTLRFYFRLDALLDSVLVKRQKLPEAVQMILRVALYSILFLERVPDHASVHTAVSYCKTLFDQKLANVANGALRALVQVKERSSEKSFYKKEAHFYSLPTWLHGYFVKAYGGDIAKIVMAKFLQRPNVALRLNPKHTSFNVLNNFFKHQEHVKPVGHSGYVFLEGNVSREALSIPMQTWHEEGAFSWQAAGSQEVLQRCFDTVPELKEGVWWDACAGQGGKTIALLEQNISVALASDISFSRLSLLQDNCARLNLKTPMLVQGGAEKSWHNFEDSCWMGNILLDAPCSGFGTLARRPEIRLHRTYDDVQSLISIQREIVQKTFSLLKTGNFLVYMTCTYNPAENENLMEEFLKNNFNAEIVYSWQTPFEHVFLEGMYVCVLRKK